MCRPQPSHGLAVARLRGALRRARTPRETTRPTRTRRVPKHAGDVATAGMHVLMAADANVARPDQDHNAALHTIYRSIGDYAPQAKRCS